MAGIGTSGPRKRGSRLKIYKSASAPRRAKLSDTYAHHIFRRRHGVTLRLNPHMQGDKQCAFAMEALSDNDKIVGVEHFASTYYGIEGAETCVVEHDVAAGIPPAIRSLRMVSVRCNSVGRYLRLKADISLCRCYKHL